MGPSWGLLWLSRCGVALAVWLGYVTAPLPSLSGSQLHIRAMSVALGESFSTTPSHVLKNAPDVKWGISPLPLGHVLCTHSPSERSLSVCSVPGEHMLEMLGRFITHTLPSGTPHTSMRSSQFAVKESAKGLETHRDSQYM